MPESLIALTEGAGKNSHTFQRVIGANTVEDSVVLLGEQHLPSYMALPNAASNTTTGVKHMAQLMAGSVLNVYVRWIGIYQFALAGAATILQMQLARLTTAGTGGTTGVQTPLDSTDAAAGALSTAMPGVLGTEGALVHNFSMGAIVAAPAAALSEGVLIWQWNAERLRTKAIRIPAGTANGLAVKNVTALATATYFVVFLFSEANF